MLLNLDVELHDKQADYVECDDRFVAFIGGIGSGKTIGGCFKGIMHAKPGTLGAVVAPTYPILRDATLRTFLYLLDTMHIPYHYIKNEKLMTLANGAEIIFRSADNPDYLRGPNLHWAYIDEAALCSDGTWEIMLGRLRADGKARPMWVASTPRGRGNWLYKAINQMTMFRTATWENPFLDPAFVHSLQEAYVGQFADQELQGLFVSFEGLVYPEFDRAIHVIDQIPYKKIKEYHIGVDEGYTNPCASIVYGFDSDGRMYVVDEYYERHVLQKDFVNTIKAQYNKYNVFMIHIDPSAAGLIAELAEQGLPVLGAMNDVIDGIHKVKARLIVQGDGLPRLMLDRSAVCMMAEFESYIWKTGRTKADELKPDDQKQLPPKDEPIKQNDHALDTTRYVALGYEYGHGIYI